MALVSTEKRDSAVILTLNSAANYNAVTTELLQQAKTALHAVFEDRSASAVIVTGAGKAFCAGADVEGAVFGPNTDVAAYVRTYINPLIRQMRTARIPVVTAVNGVAAGAGVGLALAGDIVIAARSARFKMAFASLGAALDAGASYFLTRAVGDVRARALAMLDEPVSAEAALQMGLVWRVVEDGALLDEALAITAQLARKAPLALGFIKHQLNDAGRLDDFLEQEAQFQARAFATADLREGVDAFLHQRPPTFRGG